jgi:hypothetical protein
MIAMYFAGAATGFDVLSLSASYSLNPRFRTLTAEL